MHIERRTGVPKNPKKESIRACWTLRPAVEAVSAIDLTKHRTKLHIYNFVPHSSLEFGPFASEGRSYSLCLSRQNDRRKTCCMIRHVTCYPCTVAVSINRGACLFASLSEARPAIFEPGKGLSIKHDLYHHLSRVSKDGRDVKMPFSGAVWDWKEDGGGGTSNSSPGYSSAPSARFCSSV